MFSPARILLTLAFLLWTILLLGGSGLVGWIGDGLAGVMSQIHLGWLASAAAGLGKALIFFIWFISAIFFAIFFSLSGQIGRIVQASTRAAEQQSRKTPAADKATVTLERDADGSYR
jgi:hypothetical protein